MDEEDKRKVKMKSKDRVTYYSIRAIGEDEPKECSNFATAQAAMEEALNYNWLDLDAGRPPRYEAVRVEVTPI